MASIMLNVLLARCPCAVFDALSYLLFIPGFPRRCAPSSTESPYLPPSIKWPRGWHLVDGLDFNHKKTLLFGASSFSVPGDCRWGGRTLESRPVPGDSWPHQSRLLGQSVLGDPEVSSWRLRFSGFEVNAGSLRGVDDPHRPRTRVSSHASGWCPMRSPRPVPTLESVQGTACLC